MIQPIETFIRTPRRYLLRCALLLLLGACNAAPDVTPTRSPPPVPALPPTASPAPSPTPTQTPVPPTVVPSPSLTASVVPDPSPTATPRLDTVEPLFELVPDPLQEEGPSTFLPLRVAIFVGVRSPHRPDPGIIDEVERLVRTLWLDTQEVYDQCGIRIEVEGAHVIRLPAHLYRIRGNDESSWGGHPPHEVENAELFNYEQHEQLTADARELFAYGKSVSSPNAISVFIVGEIIYHAAQQRTGATGLSFPPVVYHQEQDYPYRNSVLLVGRYDGPGSIPRVDAGNLLAHELGHMLLNEADHPLIEGNLMSSAGPNLLDTQCMKMRENLQWLYGSEAVVDPGPPGD